ncbi:MAG TPA: Stp1/IreP family PP2C-type Ser/Thr phosphatase [Polyangium sp.]|nr:Stp1/IreP family PP2C-type Ser/Thr phosphatase [Polyangium sp.]
MSKTQPGRAIRIEAAGLTDVGRQRRHNEDNVLVAPKVGLFLVADGMGGHSTGHVASALAASSMQTFFDSTESGPLPSPIPADEANLPRGAARLVQGVRKANRDVYEVSSTRKENRGMGSTIVAIHFDGSDLHVAHVGDSRCYRLRDGNIEQITRDHSLINDALALKPDLTQEELARLPKNVITRALGMKDAVKVDIQSVHVEPEDIFLLCSDGLTGMINNDQILEVFSLTNDLDEACELLIAMANEAGGTDNISALLVRAETFDPNAPDVSIADADIDVEEAVLSQPLPPEHEFDDDGTPPAPKPIVEITGSADDDEDIDGETDAWLGDTVPVDMRKRQQLLNHDVAIEHVDVVEEDASLLDVGDDDAPPSIDDVMAARCRRCNHELYVGNFFCTECGLKIDPD